MEVGTVSGRKGGYRDERMEVVREKNDNFDKLYQSIADYNEKLYRQKQSGMVGTSSFEQVDFDLREFGFDEDIFGYITIPKKTN